MRILVAPCAYKGTVSALELAETLTRAVSDLGHEARALPFADGGDDTLAVLHSARGGTYYTHEVTGPLGKKLEASYLAMKDAGGIDSAVVELASASGIAHLQVSELDAMRAQTRGFGELISYAIEDGARNLYLTIGGSASTDGGSAALSALGAVFTRAYNDSISDGGIIADGGGGLLELARVDTRALAARTRHCRFTVVSDVESPLLGPRGAAAVFAPQKGASPEQVDILERALFRFAQVSGRQDLVDMPGAGAAGGTGFGLAAYLGAPIVRGFDWLSVMLDLPEHLKWCDAVVVAEGRLDGQSFATGKAVGRIAALAREFGRQVWALPATVGDYPDDAVDMIIETASGGSATTATASQAMSELITRLDC